MRSPTGISAASFSGAGDAIQARLCIANAARDAIPTKKPPSPAVIGSHPTHLVGIWVWRLSSESVSRTDSAYMTAQPTTETANPLNDTFTNSVHSGFGKTFSRNVAIKITEPVLRVVRCL